jgi:hypothetical protein
VIQSMEIAEYYDPKLVSRVMELCRFSDEYHSYGHDRLPPSTVQVWFKTVNKKGHLLRD